MIPLEFVTQWRKAAPWTDLAQVEQDLIISRALVEIFSSKELAGRLAFRGGTALHKLHLAPAARYSEDLDLVQVTPEPIGETITALRRVLGWIGTKKPAFKSGPFSAKLTFAATAEAAPKKPLKVKVEINTREHVAFDGHTSMRFEVDNPFFSGATDITTFSLEELLATKLRALYQRKKGRDLFDLWWANRASPRWARAVELFATYMEREGSSVAAEELRANLEDKFDDKAFLVDLSPLLRGDVNYDVVAAQQHARALLGHMR